MEPQFPPARRAHASEAWECVLRPLARVLSDSAGELSVAIVNEIRETFPELFDDPGAFEENLRATEANVRLLAEAIDSGRDPATLELPAANRAFARASVERGVPITGGLRSLRLGHAILLRWLVAEARRLSVDPDTLERAIDLAAAWSFALIDMISVEGEQAYEAERTRWLRSASARQAELIGLLLGGETLDVTATSRQLGYDLTRRHLAMLAWLEDPPDELDALSALEEEILTVAERLGAARPLTQARGTHVMAAWLIVPNEIADAALASSGQVNLAVGLPADGPRGFRASYQQAALARNVAVLRGSPQGTITGFAEAALTSLATADIEQARAFVSSALGPLLPRDALTRRLAATVRAYLEEDSSHSRAAHRLEVHENTVRYRIRQAEELLGEPITARSLDLRVALHIADAALTEPAAPGSAPAP